MKKGAGINWKYVFIFLAVLFLSSLVVAGKIKIDSNKKDFSDKNIEINGINEVKESVKSGNVKVLVKFKNESSFSTFVDEKSLSAFENNPDVLDIIPIRMRQVMLQDSVPIINGSATWTLTSNSLNLTGQGQTICVIDTGVNYSHPDLGGCYGNNSNSSNCKVIGGWDYCADGVNCTTEDSDPMDVHGHGTHVAGIAVANNSVKGVAPGAKIVMIKAGNNTGTFWDDDLIKAIQWCVNNASSFNISVISMSLGGGLYDTYCDSDADGDGVPSGDEYNYVGNFSAAIAQNISIVAASGNDGYYNAISAPACVESAIPVTSTNKTDDYISYFADTWDDSSLSIIAAPGLNINSTKKAGGYVLMNGTSMSTPHVAGAIAIINQYLESVGRSKTPGEIEIILNNTGKQIYDSYAQRYFSRIDVYNAIVYLDSEGYSVNLISPSDATYTNQNQSYNCSATSVSSISNITLKIWNSSNVLVYNHTDNISGTSNSSLIGYNFTTEGTYYWNCEAYNSLGTARSAAANYSITYDITRPNITVNKPINNSWNNGNFSITTNEWSNCSYKLNNSANFTMSTSDNRSFSGLNQSLLQDSSYNLTFYCNDSAGNVNSSLVLFNYDITTPNVTLIEPYPSDETTSSTVKVFYYNVSDNLNITQCNLIFNNFINASNSSTINNTNSNISYTLSPGSYSWSINCTDAAGNTGNSSSRSLTITAPAETPSNTGGSPGGSGPGGAGVPATQIISLNEQQFNDGVTKSVGAGDKISFSSNKENHSLTINRVVNQTVNITIRSEPINLVLAVGESVRLNLTSAEFYDLFVKVESASVSKANITLKQINESITQTGGKKDGSGQEGQGQKVIMNDYFTGKNSKNYLWVIAGIIIIVVIVYIVIKLRTSKKYKKAKRVR